MCFFQASYFHQHR
jgi:hypothetical protein